MTEGVYPGQRYVRLLFLHKLHKEHEDYASGSEGHRKEGGEDWKGHSIQGI